MPADGEVGALDAIATTRSIHRYRSDPIPDADLGRILWSATRGPSGSNSQPFRFVVLRDGPRAAKAKGLLGDAFRRSWAEKSGSEGWKKGSGAKPDSRKARTARAMQRFVDRFEEIPVVVLVCALRYRAPHPYEGASIYPACQNLLLAARSLGYGGTIAIWHVACEAALRELLEIPEDVFIAATIPLGVPEGRHGPLRRRPVRELVFDDVWQGEAGWIADEPDARLSSPGSLSHTRYRKASPD
ncbi:MAG: nitroreductase family protein [Myxococcota bacterium]|nr:nitroreductase family protein [Myxococcota bacterium]